MPRFISCFAALGLVFGLAVGAEAALDVNGNLDDWGLTTNGTDILTYGGGIVNNPNPNSSAGHGEITNFWDTASLYYHAEDTSTSYVGPNWGGQNYDAEFLGAVRHGSELYLAIATGQRPNNGFTNFAPGDIRIGIENAVFGIGRVYGIEVGGGPGKYYNYHPPTPDKILAGDFGTTYDLYDSGHTYGFLKGDGSGAFNRYGTSYTPTNPELKAGVHNPGQTAGSVWLTHDSDWVDDPIPPPLPTQFQITSGLPVGASADYVYQFADIGTTDLGQHAFIELSVDLATLDLDPVLHPGTMMNVAWRPSCGNDDSWLRVEVPMSPPPIPEPASVVVWAVLALTVGGCGWWRRRSKRGV